MDRHWLISWTTYGSRVAGDEDGFVSNVYALDGGTEVRHNAPGTDCSADMPLLESYVRDNMLDEPYYLVQPQAETLIAQYLQTCGIRKFELCAASVMYNHTHILVGVPGDPDPHHLRELFKSWATRALKPNWPLPKSGRYWTAKGSVRKKEGDAVGSSVIYVARLQPKPLAAYVGERWCPLVAQYDTKASVDA